jgi:4,5-dihydroxyphthalate decarboxylase
MGVPWTTAASNAVRCAMAHVADTSAAPICLSTRAGACAAPGPRAEAWRCWFAAGQPEAPRRVNVLTLRGAPSRIGPRCRQRTATPSLLRLRQPQVSDRPEIPTVNVPSATRVPLTFACGMYDRTLPLQTGEVQPDGIDLNFVVNNDPRDIFDRMAGRQEFDLSEMSSSEFISGFDSGRSPFVALPVFPSRVFRHGFLFVHGGIRSPRDLEGGRIGVPLYTMTAAIWMRGLLQDYGVDLSKITWVQGALHRPGKHGDATAAPLLRPIPIEQNATNKSLAQLLADREIDAIMSSQRIAGLGTNPNIRRLFPDYPEAEKDYYRRTKIFPIMHLIVIRRAAYEANPFIAQSLYDAFEAAKARAIVLMREVRALRYMLPWMGAEIEQIDELFGGDAFPYGVEPNRRTLEALVKYMADQGFIRAPIPIEQLFVPVASSARAT